MIPTYTVRLSGKNGKPIVFEGYIEMKTLMASNDEIDELTIMPIDKEISIGDGHILDRIDIISENLIVHSCKPVDIGPYHTGIERKY